MNPYAQPSSGASAYAYAQAPADASAPPPVAVATAVAVTDEREMAGADSANKVGVAQTAKVDEASASNAKVEIVPGSVMATLPQLLPEAQILQQYQAQGYSADQLQAEVAKADADATGKLGNKGKDSSSSGVAFAEAVPDGQFFSPEEINVLNAQPVPVAIDYDSIMNAAPPPPAGFEAGAAMAPPQVALQPANGAMPIVAGAYSQALVKVDKMHSGVKTSDECLCNKDELLRFFNQHNAPPQTSLYVEGWHTETYVTTDGNGNTQTNTRHVTDFVYEIDLTKFIFPFGKITTEGSANKSVEEMMQEFLEDGNRLKSLQMKKKVFWDFAQLQRMVRSYIRAMGWRRGLTVRARFRHKSVRVTTPSKLARSWDSRFGRTMMCVTVVPAVAMAIYGSGHRERGMRSVFIIQASPLQVFDAIRPCITVPMYRGGCSVM